MQKYFFRYLNTNFENMEQLEILQLIHQIDLTVNYKNMETTYRIFLYEEQKEQKYFSDCCVNGNWTQKLFRNYNLGK